VHEEVEAEVDSLEVDPPSVEVQVEEHQEVVVQPLVAEGQLREEDHRLDVAVHFVQNFQVVHHRLLCRLK
jgi:hypothetical protein